MLAQPPGSAHELGSEIEQIPPPGGVHLVFELRQLGHLAAQVGGVVGVQPLRQQPEALWGQSQGLAQVTDDALDLVGGDGPGQHGVLGPEVAVYPLDQLVSQPPREVEVDVGQRGHVLGDEALQG